MGLRLRRRVKAKKGELLEYTWSRMPGQTKNAQQALDCWDFYSQLMGYVSISGEVGVVTKLLRYTRATR
jgi:hypothetical protein